MTGARSVRFDGLTPIELAGERLALVVLPEFGGRVTSLTDRQTRREWLLGGELGAAAPRGRAAAYDANVAWGWDECLPTVAPGADPARPQATLRDHGDVWGRGLSVAARAGAQMLTTSLHGSTIDGWPYMFTRTLTLEGASVLATYELENRGDRPLPFLWSMHPLLALEPGSRLHLSAVTHVMASFAAGTPASDLLPAGRPRRIGWPAPGLPGGGRYRLDLIPGSDAGDALKLYAGPLEQGRAGVSGVDGSWLGLAWDVAVAPYLGIWLSNGGWPEPGRGVRQHALEPTTAPVNDLSEAVASGLALWVQPAEQRAWWARLEVGTPDDDLAAFLRGCEPMPATR